MNRHTVSIIEGSNPFVEVRVESPVFRDGGASLNILPEHGTSRGNGVLNQLALEYVANVIETQVIAKRCVPQSDGPATLEESLRQIRAHFGPSFNIVQVDDDSEEPAYYQINSDTVDSGVRLMAQRHRD